VLVAEYFLLVRGPVQVERKSNDIATHGDTAGITRNRLRPERAPGTLPSTRPPWRCCATTGAANSKSGWPGARPGPTPGWSQPRVAGRRSTLSVSAKPTITMAIYEHVNEATAASARLIFHI
jgi:hypothetical protein